MTKLNMIGNGQVTETERDTTRIREPAELAGLLRGKLSCRNSRETLKRRWIESSEIPYEQEPSHVSATKSSLVRDKLFSPQPDKENELNPEEGMRIHQTRATSRTNIAQQFFTFADIRSLNPLPTLVGQIHENAVMNDLTEVERILSCASPPLQRLLEAAANAEKGIETLRALFILRGDQITITQRHVRKAAGNESHGADMLELFLLLRRDEITIADMESVAKAAAANQGSGMAVMEILLSQYRDQMTTIDLNGIVTAAAANEGQGSAIIGLLLDRHGDHIRFTGKVAKAAAANRGNGMAVMELLLNRYGDQMTMAEREDTFKTTNAHSSLDVKLRVSILLLRIAIKKHESCETLFRLFPKTDIDVTGSVKSFGWEMLSCAAPTCAPHSEENEVFKLILEKSQIEDGLKDKDALGWTPLFWAIFKGDDGVVKALVDTGKVNIKNIEEKRRQNQKAFSWAAELGLEKIVEQLLRIDGIQVDSKDDKYGRTPLIWAAKEGRERVVQVLLEKCKVDIFAKDKDGRTPFAYAKEKNYAGIMKLLQAKAG